METIQVGVQDVAGMAGDTAEGVSQVSSATTELDGLSEELNARVTRFHAEADAVAV